MFFATQQKMQKENVSRQKMSFLEMQARTGPLDSRFFTSSIRQLYFQFFKHGRRSSSRSKNREAGTRGYFVLFILFHLCMHAQKVFFIESTPHKSAIPQYATSSSNSISTFYSSSSVSTVPFSAPWSFLKVSSLEALPYTKSFKRTTLSCFLLLSNFGFFLARKRDHNENAQRFSLTPRRDFSHGRQARISLWAFFHQSFSR